MSLNQELEFEANQLRDIVLFELRTAEGTVRKQLMRARNMLWLVGTQLRSAQYYISRCCRFICTLII